LLLLNFAILSLDLEKKKKRKNKLKKRISGCVQILDYNLSDFIRIQNGQKRTKQLKAQHNSQARLHTMGNIMLFHCYSLLCLSRKNVEDCKNEIEEMETLIKQSLGEDFIKKETF